MEKRRGGKKECLFFCHCDRQSNHLNQSRRDSRTDYSLQTHSHFCLLSCWFLCNSLIYEPFLSTRPPSNSDQSDHFYTAAEASQTSLDDQDMAAPLPLLSPSCCCQTVWGFCLLCLCPLWVHRHLMERTRHNTAAVYHLTQLMVYLNRLL